MNQTTLTLDAITVDDEIQQRLTINEDLVNEYAETITDWLHTAPLTVFRDESGKHWLADGFHRHSAAVKANLMDVDVEVRSGTKRDAIVHSLSANSAHGARRTVADLAKAYETAVTLGICAAADTDTVARLLNCSTRRASDLTADARAKIKEQQRAAIYDHLDKGLSQREVAKLLGVSPATVNTAVQKRHASKTERRAEEPPPLKSDATARTDPTDPRRQALAPWQRDLLDRIDAQAALNGHDAVAEAISVWMGNDR